VVESLLDGDRGEVFFWCGSVLVHGESKSRIGGVFVGCGSGRARSCVNVGGYGIRIVVGGGEAMVNKRSELSQVREGYVRESV
jgi:hypothetical protein